MSKIKKNQKNIGFIPDKKVRLEDFVVLEAVDDLFSSIKIDEESIAHIENTASLKKKHLDEPVSIALQNNNIASTDKQSEEIKEKNKADKKNSSGIDSKVDDVEGFGLENKSKKSSQPIKDGELDYRRNVEQARAYEESFKAYQRIMNEYFKGSVMNSYSNDYSSNGQDTKSKVPFDVTENKRQEMIKYTKEMFKNRTYSTVGDPRMDIGRRTDYEIWKSLSALNLALSFIYYDRPAMVDSLGNDE